MGIDETIWVDIHGPKDEIDEIEVILRPDLAHLVHLYKNQSNLFEKESTTIDRLLQTDGGKLFTLYKNGHTKGNLTFDVLLGFPDLNFSPLDDRDKDGKLNDNFRREKETHLHAYSSFTYRGSYPTIEENIIELSKHFPNTLFRYHCESEECHIGLLICRHTNGKHVVWSTGWQQIQHRRWWTGDEIRSRIAERENTTTTVDCGCKPLLMPCEYISPIYDCYVEIYGIDKEVVDIFEKRGVKVKQNREGLWMHFKYTKNPIQLMEWLSEKYKGCYFICTYKNEKGTYCRWEEYRAVHYPYTGDI